jgi:hypothetical protein
MDMISEESPSQRQRKQVNEYQNMRESARGPPTTHSIGSSSGVRVNSGSPRQMIFPANPPSNYASL